MAQADPNIVARARDLKGLRRLIPAAIEPDAIVVVLPHGVFVPAPEEAAAWEPLVAD